MHERLVARDRAAGCFLRQICCPLAPVPAVATSAAACWQVEAGTRNGRATPPRVIAAGNPRRSGKAPRRATRGPAGAFFRPRSNRHTDSKRSDPLPAGLSPAKSGQRRSLVDETQRGIASLRLSCWRREDNTGCKQSFAHLLSDDVADPRGINVPGQQLYRMRPRPFSLLVGALAARPAAKGGRSPARIDLEPFLAHWAAHGSTA
jgi:hypothetical protein